MTLVPILSTTTPDVPISLTELINAEISAVKAGSLLYKKAPLDDPSKKID
jgi:hypothetical protein